MSGRNARRTVLLSRETLLGLVAALVLAAVCVGLGMWQFGRYEDKRDAAAVIRANYDAPPLALEDALPDPEAPLPASEQWRSVTLHGSYCQEPGCVLYVRNRQHSGNVGFWQLAAFRPDHGPTMLVVRGWVPSDSAESQPLDPPPIPDGELTATVRLRPAEEVLDREPPPGQTHSVDPRQSAGLMGLADDDLVTGAFGELVSEDPAADRPTALPSPETSLGPHLSYAVQWWVFALFFPGALVHRTRRQLQDLAQEEQEGPPGQADRAGPAGGAGASGAAGTAGTAHHRPRRAVRARRRGQDEEEEDALIDQQER